MIMYHPALIEPHLLHFPPDSALKCPFIYSNFLLLFFFSTFHSSVMRIMIRRLSKQIRLSFPPAHISLSPLCFITENKPSSLASCFHVFLHGTIWSAANHSPNPCVCVCVSFSAHHLLGALKVSLFTVQLFLMCVSNHFMTPNGGIENQDKVILTFSSIWRCDGRKDFLHNAFKIFIKWIIPQIVSFFFFFEVFWVSRLKIYFWPVEQYNGGKII